MRRSWLVLCLLLSLTLTAWAETPKPRLLLLATGGTIAGVSSSNSTISYKPGQLTAEQILAAVPGAQAWAEIQVEQVCNIASQNITSDMLLKLARRIDQALVSGSADCVVITHGTDTMEETAFFLEQVLTSDKPVVLVAAMRPASAISADGPANLLAAIKTAVCPESAQRGVLVVMNGTIFESRSVSKMHTVALNAFGSSFGGPVGQVADHVDYFVATEKYPRPRFALDKLSALPKVDIIYAHTAMDASLVEAAVKAGAKGIVLAGVGDGNASDSVIAALAKAAAQGVMVVRASRIDNGCTYRCAEVNDDEYGFIAAMDLNPQKARIMLQLLLASGEQNVRIIQEQFRLR